jgi:hypothetical protein
MGLLSIAQPLDETLDAAEVDDFDGEFGDASDLMDVDILNDCAVSQRVGSFCSTV